MSCLLYLVLSQSRTLQAIDFRSRSGKKSCFGLSTGQTAADFFTSQSTITSHAYKQSTSVSTYDTQPLNLTVYLQL
jgi:hypothetical protein